MIGFAARSSRPISGRTNRFRTDRSLSAGKKLGPVKTSASTGTETEASAATGAPVLSTRGRGSAPPRSHRVARTSPSHDLLPVRHHRHAVAEGGGHRHGLARGEDPVRVGRPADLFEIGASPAGGARGQEKRRARVRGGGQPPQLRQQPVPHAGRVAEASYQDHAAPKGLRFAAVDAREGSPFVSSQGEVHWAVAVGEAVEPGEGGAAAPRSSQMDSAPARILARR
mmetsp:Transcript_37993/g.88392  ORF Transcript_37993/g.88392 Transcript_37993/m.88392 type:complete len:226 (+) Transcript_37993:538-1215(+)